MPTPFADTLDDITKERRRKLTIPSSNLRSPAQYGTGYGRSEDILRTIPGVSNEEAWNALGADFRRGQMAESLRPIAQVGVGSDMPTITGADYRQRNDILEAIRPPADLDPGNVGRGLRYGDPLAELRNTATAMGRDPRDVLANLRNTEGMTEQAKARYRQRNEDIAITDRRQRAAAEDILAQIQRQGDVQLGITRQQGQNEMGVEGVRGQNAIGVEGVRGQNALGVTRQEGRNATDVEFQRGQNAIRQEGLKGSTEATLEGLRGANAIRLEGVRQQDGGESYKRGIEDGFKAANWGAAGRQQGGRPTGGMSFADPAQTPGAPTQDPRIPQMQAWLQANPNDPRAASVRAKIQAMIGNL